MALDVPLLRRSFALVIERQPRLTDEMYDWVGASLLAALAEAAGPEWTDEVEAAWQAAYGAVAGLRKGGTSAG